MNDLRVEEIVEHGSDAGRGNLLGIQPFMTTGDYASEESFSARMDAYLAVAGPKGWLSQRTVVVLPEHLGTWLAVAGEKARARKAPTIASAMRALALSHAIPFARMLVASPERDRMAAGLFRMKAHDMARIYQTVFSSLAKKYTVTLVAGSILLPGPEVWQGVVAPGHGPLYNVSAVYRPDGQAHASLVRKAFLTLAELPFVTPAPVDELPAFDTPAGRLGVLICADSWYPAAYERLRAQRVDFVAVPSAITSHGLWDRPWAGYDGKATPEDVDERDIGVLTEGQAWRKYALAGRIAQAGAQQGVNVFLRGALWDLGTDNGCAVLVDGQTVIEAGRDGPAVLNLWL